MKIVIAADKFKHSLSSFAFCKAVKEGLQAADPAFDITCLPLADGGDGLAEVMAYYSSFQKVEETVSDPLGQPVKATYLYSEEQSLAFIEMAAASGLQLLQPSQFNCAITSTYGTGELVKKAIQRGAKELIVGVGGSATHDCGIGMAAALGWRFLDRNGVALKPIGENLLHIHTIDTTARLDLGHVTVKVACDVTNYLTGPQGAARVYGPQKGATPLMVEQLEEGMLHFAAVVKKQVGTDIKNIRGGGAAGGMGAGCVLFLNAAIISGAELIFQYSNAEAHIQKADMVITGEGRLDEQTLNGKLVAAVTKLCHKHQKPVIALCGIVDLPPERWQECGLSAAFSIVNKPMKLEEAMLNAAALLSESAFAVGNLLKGSVGLRGF
jgi:glycerate kinase